MSEELKNLYQGVILAHNDNPVNFEKKPEVPHVLEAYNPVCGDKFKLYLETENGKVTQAYFYGYGCAISKASTSVLVKKMIGMDAEALQQLLSQFYQTVGVEASGPSLFEKDEEIDAFAAARQFPGRIKCATLSWDSLKEHLEALNLR